MNFLSQRFLILAVCLIFTAGAAAQEKKKKSDKQIEPPKNTLTVKTNIAVFDAAMRPVNDLKIADLKLFEDDQPQTVTALIKKESPLQLGIVVDNSLSLRSQFKTIMQAASTIIANLKPEDEVFLMRFVSSDKIELVQKWTKDKDLLQRGLENMFLEGGQSAPIDAVYLAAQELMRNQPDKGDKVRRALIMLTDGEERDSFHKADELFDYLKDKDLQIYSLGFTGDIQKGTFLSNGNKPNPKQKAENLLHRLAFETGGFAFPLGKEKDALETALKTLLADLSAPYLLTYESTQTGRNGSFRRLRAEAADAPTGEKRLVFTREGFIVPQK